MSHAVLPKKRWGVRREAPTSDAGVGERVFDKAEKAEAEETLAERIAELTEEVDNADEFSKVAAEEELAELMAEQEASTNKSE